ncbi:MAG: hypothetical protein HKN47_17260 [Pirellulaceae bacterium]|nr:hypothetical protein [Pirellulaceae bacterium]
MSDAWMLGQRFKRIIVSAAGIMAELTLAAIALLLWTMIGAGFIRDLLMTVVVVCSVSTVVFNGNPLLRYDGYYILCDMFGVPNLASESSQMIRNWFRRLVWALPAETNQTASVGQTRHWTFYVGYGVLSGIYRIVVVLMIAWFLRELLADIGLKTVGTLVVGLLVVAMAMRMFKPIIQAPPRAMRRASMDANRRRWLMASLGCILAIGVVVPLPRSVVAPMTVRPSNAVEIYVPIAGVVVAGMEESSDVHSGDPIATLSNASSDFELQQQLSEQQQIRTRIEALRQRQITDPRAASELPAAEEMLMSVTRRVEWLEQERQRLIVRSPADGRFFPALNRSVVPDQTDPAAVTWDGVPLSRKNRGAYLEQGTLLGMVGDAKSREGLALVDQRDIALVKSNQNLTVLWGGTPRGTATGRIENVAVSPISEFPPELIASGRIGSAADLANGLAADATYYQVRIALAGEGNSLPVRSTHNVVIRVQPASLLSRWMRSLGDLLDK